MSQAIKHDKGKQMSDTDKIKADARKELIKDIADLSDQFSFHAGTDGVQLAGAIVSYLAKNLDQIEPFLNRTDFLEFEQAYDVANGCLTFLSEDGKIRTPEELQIARAERQANATNTDDFNLMFGIGENQSCKTDDILDETQPVAANQLRAIIELIERFEEEKKTISDDIREVYSDVRTQGFDVKAVREIIRLRKKETNERQEEEAMLQMYKDALGIK